MPQWLINIGMILRNVLLFDELKLNGIYKLVTMATAARRETRSVFYITSSIFTCVFSLTMQYGEHISV